jgi:two-component system chemotaxis sensor kinase CheA
LTILQNEIKRISGKIKSITGMGDEGDTRGEKSDLSVIISINKLNKLIDHIQADIPSEENRHLVRRLCELKKVPCQKLFARFPNMVERISTKLKKNVKMDIEGGDVLVDVELLDKIGDAVVHLVRNAVDHGMEMSDQRIESGKNETGKILLKAAIQNGKLEITIRDDGKGIDLNALGKKAVEKNILSREDWDKISLKEKQELIFYPGLSTKNREEVSDISGRGVGMDVVKNSISKLNGDILIQSVEKEGTEFRLLIPL